MCLDIGIKIDFFKENSVLAAIYPTKSMSADAILEKKTQNLRQE